MKPPEVFWYFLGVALVVLAILGGMALLAVAGVPID